MTDTFQCTPYNCRLSRPACAARYLAGNTGKMRAGTGAMRTVNVRTSHCRGCEIGAAHARGERHESAPDVLLCAVLRPAVAVPVRPTKYEKAAGQQAAARRVVRRQAMSTNGG